MTASLAAACQAFKQDMAEFGDAMKTAIATAAGTWTTARGIDGAERARRGILTLRWQVENLQVRLAERDRVIFALEDEINDRRARAWVEGIEPVPVQQAS